MMNPSFGLDKRKQAQLMELVGRKPVALCWMRGRLRLEYPCK